MISGPRRKARGNRVADGATRGSVVDAVLLVPSAWLRQLQAANPSVAIRTVAFLIARGYRMHTPPTRRTYANAARVRHRRRNRRSPRKGERAPLAGRIRRWPKA